MKADPRFAAMPKSFWAYVRSLSEGIGYTKAGKIRVPSTSEVWECLNDLRLATTPLFEKPDCYTNLGNSLQAYFVQRALILNMEVEPALMNAEQAASLCDAIRKKFGSSREITLNKQKGEKKKEAYLTSMVSMMIEASCGGYDCNFNPLNLTAFTKNGVPVRTLSRRVDGAFPAVINPVAIWEIKEYYHTTTFGSRVADGVYETQLDGLEIEEMRIAEGISVSHYLFLDAHYTWWDCGKSYLCRIYDMTNMGLVDEVIVGRNVLTRVPILVRDWIHTLEKHLQLQDSPKQPLNEDKGQAILGF